MRWQLLGLTAGTLVLASCGNMTSYGGGGGGATCTPTATMVCMIGQSFSPATLTIAHGTTVTWQNGSGLTHTVTSSSTSTQAFNSGSIASGGTFMVAFPTAGTYYYYCQFHGADGAPPTGMSGKVTVN